MKTIFFLCFFILGSGGFGFGQNCTTEQYQALVRQVHLQLIRSIDTLDETPQSIILLRFHLSAGNTLDSISIWPSSQFIKMDFLKRELMKSALKWNCLTDSNVRSSHILEHPVLLLRDADKKQLQYKPVDIKNLFLSGSGLPGIAQEIIFRGKLDTIYVGASQH